MKLKNLTVQLILIVLTSMTIGICKAEDICRLFPNETVIRDPFLCSQYIECVDFKSHYYSCKAPKPYFNIKKNQCVAELDNYDTCYENSCVDDVGDFIPDPFSCNGYFYCLDEQTPLRAECASGHFNDDSKACINEQHSDCKENTNIDDYCSFVPQKVKFKKEGTTNTYYVCNNATGPPQSKTCEKKLDYLSDVGDCGSALCGTHSSPTKLTYVTDPKSCAGYYHCRKTTSGRDENPIHLKCPTDMFFSEKKQECVDPVDVSCTNNRCEGRTKQFVVSSTKGCRHYWICSNGEQVIESTCGNTFFNEHYGICSSQVLQYPACTPSTTTTTTEKSLI